nr:MAG TPA: hypothetical protein [Crassvirales sp.]
MHCSYYHLNISILQISYYRYVAIYRTTLYYLLFAIIRSYQNYHSSYYKANLYMIAYLQ